ncbi:MAG: hypothetical protein K940chlam3_01324 [Chlamydiae bacterium]|nr:hypothetical protein [Chlamydiota bacterium]
MIRSASECFQPEEKRCKLESYSEHVPLPPEVLEQIFFWLKTSPPWDKISSNLGSVSLVCCSWHEAAMKDLTKRKIIHLKGRVEKAKESVREFYCTHYVPNQFLSYDSYMVRIEWKRPVSDKPEIWKQLEEKKFEEYHSLKMQIKEAELKLTSPRS